MSAVDDRLKAMTFSYPERIPVCIYFLPATWMRYRDELEALVQRHPVLFGPSSEIKRNYDAVAGTYVAGEHTDSWGCVWSNVHQGMEAIVTKHPLPTRASVRMMTPPTSVTGHLPHGFMFLRLADLRGFEEIMVDFAEEPEELQFLIETVLEHNMKELEVLLAGYTDSIVYFGDDLGMQTGLPISPATWRKYLKPCYMRLYQRCHAAGFPVFMHSDGRITEIIPDLIDCGVNVINPQVRANGLDKLAEVCKGKICVDLDLDRQLFPFCRPEEIDAHVREAVETLGSPQGGLWLRAECAPDVPLQNIEALCVALETYQDYFTPASRKAEL